MNANIPMAGGRIFAAALLAGAGLAGSAGPAALGSGGPTVQKAWLTGVSALSGTDAWAVGGFEHARGDAPLVEHWDGRTWKRQRAGFNDPGDSDDPAGVAVASRSVAWLAGTFSSQYVWPFAEHLNGHRWDEDGTPTPGADAGVSWLNGVAAAAPMQAWAVGGVFLGSGRQENLILQAEGNDWNQVPAPTSTASHGSTVSELQAVASVSPRDAWAVGEANTGPRPSVRWQTVIEHWNGARWTMVRSPNPSRAGCGNDRLFGVAASRAGTWAVGSYCQAPLVLQLRGSHWRQVPAPKTSAGTAAQLASVAVTSRTNAWAVGKIGTGILILRWNGTKWTRVPAPDPAGATSAVLAGVTAVSASTAWAVGQADYPNKVVKLLIEQWNGTQWSLVPVPNPPG
ncbi:MAG TPA: hypothetical protein VFI65_03910 [Streptosporangiaceae bacterium]|nr:hypothetical protein [Streptosporangiaceae bacterium]